MRSPRFALAALLAGLLVAAVQAAPADAARRHTRLLRSIPAKDTTIAASPAAVELWFSERIELPTSRVQVAGADAKVFATERLTRDDAKPESPVVARLVAPLPDGRYTVNWTAASRDGHAVKGSYQFTVRRP